MARQWVYPASVKGRFQNLHRWISILLQGILFFLPWVQVEGRQALRIDIPARRVFAFGEIYTAADAIMLVLALLISVFGLFFVTALYGRLWCGYACPQTVFLEEWIRPIERFIEGERGVRMARAKDPWAFKNLWRRVAKLVAFAGVAVLVGMGVVSWFAGARELWSGQASAVSYTMVTILAGVMFADFAWFREQFCNYLCPYARFQGALSDDGSLTISYQVEIGEPRGKGGACIDCNKCVAVCPQGIDIRNGFQLECVACARCIDACEGVMAKKGQESLVVYKPLAKQARTRPRTLIYGALLTGLITAEIFAMSGHRELQATVNRAPGTLFVVDSEGWTVNTYLLKVVNTSTEAEEATVLAENLPNGAEVRVPPVHLDPAATTTVPVIVRMRDPSGPSTPLTLTVATDDARVNLPMTFAAAGG